MATKTLRKAPPKSLFAVKFTLQSLLQRCVSKRDRECLFRLAKEAAIMTQDFGTAANLRQLQHENKPTRRA